jgi:dienelactone hydrolase
MRHRLALLLCPLFILCALCALFVASPARAASPRGGFLLLSPTDTVAVERFERAPDHLQGAMLFKMAKQRFEYTLALLPDHTVRSMNERYWPAEAAPGTKPDQEADFAFVGDSCIVDMHLEGLKRVGSAKGAIPFVNPSVLLMEQLAKRAELLGYPQNGVPMFVTAGGKSTNLTITRATADTVVIQMGRVDIRLKVDAEGDVIGGAIPLQGLRIVRVDSLSGVALQLPGTDYSAPPGAPYTAADVRVPSRHGFALAGTLTVPAGTARRWPVVVTITGSGAEDRDESLPIVRGYKPFREVADALGRRGIAVLRMDDRGYGASGGQFKNATTADFAEDVEDAVKWLRERSDIDPARVALLGHSEGGLIAPLVATRDPQLRAIVLLAGPALSGKKVLEYQNMQAVIRGEHATGARRDSLFRAAMAQVDTLAMTDAWLRWFRDHDPLPTARKVRTPVLILQGATDHQVTPEQASMLEKAFREGGNTDVTRRVFAATNHLFVPDSSGVPGGYSQLKNSNVRPVVLRTLSDWLALRLKPAAAAPAKRAR